MRIRLAVGSDADAIRDVHRSAFGEDERDHVARAALDLLLETTTPPTLSLVAEVDDTVVGHVAFSPMSPAGGGDMQFYILAPLAARPGHQRQGVGSLLVEDGVRRLSETGVNLLLVYGDPEYYGRFGFRADIAENLIPPYELEHPFGWLGVAVSDGHISQSPVRLDCVASLRDPDLW